MEKTKSHEYYMQKAIEQALKAYEILETPIGAVVVKNDRIIAKGYNLRETKQDVTLHAEIIAIRNACAILGSWRLDDCDLYVTLEPCIMCAGAIQQARIRKVFGPPQPKSGGIISKANIFDIKLNHKVEYCGGVLSNESEEILNRFFNEMRARDKSTGLTKGERRKIKKNEIQQ